MGTGNSYIVQDAAKYISEYVWPRDELLLRLEEEARQERIPIIHLESIQLLHQLVRIKKAISILEIGTAIGYSAIWLARAHSKANIISLEIDERMVVRAQANIQEAGLADRITVIHRDATLGLPKPYDEMKFDFIFLDAAKKNYDQFLSLYLPQLLPEGLLVVDNVLFHGLVFRHPEERRQAWIAQQLDDFNHKLFQHPELLTTIHPIGDGLSISIKTTMQK